MSSVNNAIKRLARSSCAAFYGVDGCRYEPNGQTKCSFFRTDPQALQFIESGDMRCFTFERSILPADAELQARYFNREVNAATCARCRHDFVKSSNAAKYCDSCRDVRKREGNRDRQRKHYWNEKAKTHENGV